MTFPRVVLWLSGAGFLAFGLLFLVDPAGTIDTVGIRLDSAVSVIEIRAMYGGLEIGLGVFFFVAAFRERWVRAGLGAQILTMGGLAAGRGIGMLAAGQADRLMVLYLAVEIGAAVIGVLAFRHAKLVLINNRFERRRVD